MLEVRVELKDAPYTIYLGEHILGQIAEELKRLKPSSVFIVTNTTVGPLYAEEVRRICGQVSRTETVVLPDGEEFKNWESIEKILSSLAAGGADRKSVVVALGGGVVGDMAGFAASVYMRGLRVIQVPTTLLAQVDSSVGGKTGFNMPWGKNMVGSFFQPSAVIADTEVLKTLPAREVSAGLAEIIKHGLLADRGYFEKVSEEMPRLLSLQSDVIADAVAHSCRIKAGVVARDAREKGERAHLNLGHTFGHAVEKLCGYGTYLHGEAVGCGLVLAAKASQEIGNISQQDYRQIVRTVESAGLPARIEGLSLSEAVRAMHMDKKSEGGVIHFVLLKEIGRAYVAELSDSVLRKVLADGGYL
jgi:3-dehydroquinate synthase